MEGQQVKCSDVQASLVDFLYEELETEDRARFAAHLEQCNVCKERWDRLQEAAAAADLWTPPALPGGITARALARIASEQAREGRHAWPYLSPAQIFSRLLLGAGAAALSLLLVLGVAGREISAPAVGILAALWTFLYTGLFLLSSHRGPGRASRAALTSVGVSLILAAPLSIPRVVEACVRLVRSAPESVSFSLVLLLLAAGYTAGPLLVGGAVFGRPRPDCWVSHGATHSLLYALVIAPAIYLQCLSLSFPVAAVWTAGAILGAVLGGPLGFRLAGRGSETT